MTVAVPGLPITPNAAQVAAQYTIPQDPKLLSGVQSLIPNVGGLDFRNLNISNQAFQNPFNPEMSDRISQLHTTAVDSIITGPQGYNNGLGPMSLDRASELLRSLGGSYPTDIFGEASNLNVFSNVIASGPTDLFSTASQVPRTMSLLGYSNNLVPNLPFYLNTSRSASFLMQSGRSLAPFSSLPGLIGPYVDPCGLTNLLFSPLIAGIRLLNVLISGIVDLITNLLTAALGAILGPIFSVLSQIQRLVQSALDTIAQALGLNEAFGLVGQILGLLNDPCIQFLLRGGGDYGKGLLKDPLKTALSIA